MSRSNVVAMTGAIGLAPLVSETAACGEPLLRGDRTGRLAAASVIPRLPSAVTLCGAIPAMPHVSD
jgi:hypothetical protein